MYLLDANVCISCLRGKNPEVAVKVETFSEDEIFVCSIVVAELLFGVLKSHRPHENLRNLIKFLSDFRSIPFDDASAEVHAHLRADLSRVGKPIGPHDLLIASIALAHDLTLVTHNVKEFRRVPDLKIEDWEAV